MRFNKLANFKRFHGKSIKALEREIKFHFYGVSLCFDGSGMIMFTSETICIKTGLYEGKNETCDASEI